MTSTALALLTEEEPKRTVTLEVAFPIYFASGAPYMTAHTSYRVLADPRLSDRDPDVIGLETAFELPGGRRVETSFSVPVKLLAAQDVVAVTALPCILPSDPARPRKALVHRNEAGDVEVTYPEE